MPIDELVTYSLTGAFAEDVEARHSADDIDEEDEEDDDEDDIDEGVDEDELDDDDMDTDQVAARG